RPTDGIAGSISEMPGGMPVIVELGIGEVNGYLNEHPEAAGYMEGQVPQDIVDYWENRNQWGMYLKKLAPEMAKSRKKGTISRKAGYNMIANQGHLSPAYGELLEVGLSGMLKKVRKRQKSENDPHAKAFLNAAEQSMLGLGEWAARYGDFLAGEAEKCADPNRAADLKEMSGICRRISTEPPKTFREAMQLIWLAHQAVHIEGHGYSCSPDHVDQLLYPYYIADKQAGRLTDDQALRLCKNFILKQFDNTFWGPDHNLTQGFCLGGSTPDGKDLTTTLSWMFMDAVDSLCLPEPLVWMRWHKNIDQKFFDFCLTKLANGHCFPLMWSDEAVPKALMKLGVSEKDAYNYIPVGCNEIGIPGMMYFNPKAQCAYLSAVEAVLSNGKGYKNKWKWKDVAPPADKLETFDRFSDAVGAYLCKNMENSYKSGMKQLQAQMKWGRTPLTSCFFEGCIENGHDMILGTKYNVLSCGGIAFANMVDCMAAVREVVYEKKFATLDEVAQACIKNFEGNPQLWAQLKAAPKHGNDDPRLDDIIELVQRMRDVPMKAICRDPRDGSEFANCHVVRGGHVFAGMNTPATPDGRLAGTPLASSMSASMGCEQSGPTAVLNSVCKLNTESWASGYQANIRFHAGMITNEAQREKLRAMLNVYFANGGQELQINVVSSETLRAAQKNPEAYSDLVVRVAGFSEFFVKLTPEIQAELIARAEHG
ncbi:MAG: hypothetical protein K9M45_02425, partial [Kiritimatiellales bacterium]|nr:hypothetical protein [Kiritimatiellales bacterium]